MISVLPIWFQKLDFIESESSCSSEALSKKELSAEELSQRLEKLIMEDRADDERIFDWIEVQTPTTLCCLCLQSSHGSPFPQTFYPMPCFFCAYMCVAYLKFKDHSEGFYKYSVVFITFIYLLVCLRDCLFGYFLFCFKSRSHV